MFNSLEDYSPSIFVAIGAIPGAIFRMQIFNRLASNTQSNLYGLILVNTIATFFLGFCLAIQKNIFYMQNNQPLYLLICVGFLGSLSTFSSFILEFFSCYIKRKWHDFYLTIFSSIIFGLLFASLGYYFGNE